MRFQFWAIAAFSTSLTACATTGMPSGGDMTPNNRTSYVVMASASDLFEIQSSQIALSKAQRPETRQLAQMLITHHTRTSAGLTLAAAASGLNPPAPTLMPMQRQMINALQGASAGSFDQLYIHQRVPAHEMALALHQNYAANGDAASLRAAAASAVPIVQQHLGQARQLD